MILPKQQPGARWHALALRDLLIFLVADENGLSADEARRRLEQYGPNQLPKKRPPSWWQIFIRQFISPLIYILTIAAIVSVIVHPEDPGDAIFIVAVLLLNAGIGCYQEGRAQQKSQALLKLMGVRASVLRAGEMYEVDGNEVVPGDIVWLETGNRVPADMRLLQANGLEIDESLLTGESLPVVKDPGWMGDDAAPMGYHRNMAYAGSIIIRGRATGVVVATGTATEIGRLALDVLGTEGGRPPLLDRMERFTRAIGGAVLIAAVVIGGFGVLFRGLSIPDMFFFSVALAVSAIPEGLPVALTVALAIATSRMARRGVIVRRLAAVEGLGSCNLISSDKTGTLTCNELTARTLYLPSGRSVEVTGEGYVPEGGIVSTRPPLSPGNHDELNGLALAGRALQRGQPAP